MSKKKLLIIVDPQYDFIEGGSLAVNGGKDAMERVATYLRGNMDKYDLIAITSDWHTPSHCSFVENGGQWPRHCVQHSKGGAIYQNILDTLNEKKVGYEVLTKGEDDDHEEYSILRNANANIYLGSMSNEFDTVDICGLALDYCVKETAIDAKRTFSHARITVLLNLTEAIGDKRAVVDELLDKGVMVV